MRNLKRALSLVLAVVMVIGLMVVGASAVSYNDFSDRGEIVNKDAVSMLTTLGIIEGQPDGSYNPAGNVDRAQMAKMISVALTNNEDCDTLYQNVNSGLTDITANWARGYINYCYVRGIIAGRGDNTFDPSANVTGVEAAKMLLAALGYNAEIEGLVGPDWALNTAALAQQLGIFRNFTKDVSEPLNRDDAALLIYNALDVEMIQQYSNGYALVYSDHRTILSSVFGVVRVEGVVTANEWARLEETDSDAALREGKTTLDEVVVYDSTTSNTTVPEGVKEDDPVTFNVTTPVEYIGKAVTMYVEKTTILANSNVIGVATNDDMNVIQATVSTEDSAKDYLKGTGVSVSAAETEYYVNYGIADDEDDAIEMIRDMDGGTSDNKFNWNGIEVEVIDNDDDGTAEYVLYTVETLSQVTRYSSRNETVTVAGMNDSKAMDFEDVVFADDVTTDDLVLFVEYGGRAYVSLPETITDTIDRIDRDENNELYVTMEGGDEYRQSYIPDVASDRDVDVNEFVIADARTAPGFDEATFVLDSNGYIVAWTQPEAVPNYALVIGSAWTQNAKEYRGQVEILMADGTEGLYDIDWDKSENAFDGSDAQQHAALEEYLGTRDVVVDNETSLDHAAGSVIKYTLDDDDVLTIKEIMHENTVDNNGNITGVADGDKIVYATEEYDHNKWLTSRLDADYEAGDGTMSVVNYTNNSWNDAPAKDYAIDRNTIAFYYEGNGEGEYGVAVGWQNMGDLDKDTYAQLWPVERKVEGGKEPSELVEVALFDQNPIDPMNDWLFVLSRNAFTSEDVMELNVVFEDGTADVITIDYDDHFEHDYAYQCAYKFSVDSDNVYDLDTDFTDANNNGLWDATEASDFVPAVTGVYLLKNGTLDIGTNVYPTVTDDSNIWDVTDMDDASEDAVAGKFTTREDDQNAVVIYSENTKSVVTAWVWDVDETADDPDIDSDYRFETLTATVNNGKVELSFTAADEDLDGWNLGGPVNVTYAISKDDGRETTRNERLAKTGETVAFNSLASGRLEIPGYTINSGSTGDYKVTVVIEFVGTTAGYDEGVTYTISGEYEFTID